MTSRLKAGIGVVLIFILGCICGGLLTSVIVHKRMAAILNGGPQAVAAALEQHLTRRLNLDEGQRAQVHEILQANVQQRQQIIAPIAPVIKALNQKTFQQISAILRPDQQEKFHRVVAEFRQNYGRNLANGGAAPAPPVGSSVGTNAPASTNAAPTGTP